MPRARESTAFRFAELSASEALAILGPGPPGSDAARLMSLVEGRFKLLRLAFGDCPACFYMAVPTGEGRLPPAARPGRGRAASGRGLNRRQALLACLGEAAELVSACHWGNETCVASSFAELGPRAIHPNALTLVSDGQFRERGRWNAVHGGYDWIPPPFDEGLTTDWVEAAPVDGGTRAWVPAAYAFIGHSDRLGEDSFCVGDSNGCASAASRDEAFAAGFLELVERDATAIWWYGRHRRPLVDLESLDAVGPLLAWHRSRGRVHHLLDITTDLGIPAFAAVSANEDGGAVAFGTSAHFVAQRSARAAITEMLQVELSFEMWRLGSGAPGADPIRTWLSDVSLASEPQLRPSAAPPRRLEADEPRGDPTPWLDRCREVCDRHALTLLKIDLTRSEIGVPVVRALVPGLRPYHARFAPGRLYQVPVKLGWCSRPMPEARLNPTPIMV